MLNPLKPTGTHTVFTTIYIHHLFQRNQTGRYNSYSSNNSHTGVPFNTINITIEPNNIQYFEPKIKINKCV
jgi:hypothetical protein